jgi:hypothetical protein
LSFAVPDGRRDSRASLVLIAHGHRALGIEPWASSPGHRTWGHRNRALAAVPSLPSRHRGDTLHGHLLQDAFAAGRRGQFDTALFVMNRHDPASLRPDAATVRRFVADPAHRAPRAIM